MPTRANRTEQLELAWAAGFVDGEGFIGTHECTHPGNKSRGFTAVFDVSQVRREPLVKLQSLIGGNLRPFNDDYGTTWCWRAYGKNALVALKLVLPYLVNKRRQAELVIEFQKTKVKNGGHVKLISLEVEARREAIHFELKALNSRRKRLDAERLNEATPRVGEDGAIVRPHGNNNHESATEMIAPVVH